MSNNPYAYGGNYRQNLFDYYGLSAAGRENLVVHHIDMNRKNRSISNLLLLPNNLHRRYHRVLRQLGCNSEGMIDTKVYSNKANQFKNPEKAIRFLKDYLKIREEMEIWFVLKQCREFLSEHK